MPRIFISYRRADSAMAAGRIHDRLVAVFGRENIFKDVDDIPPGVDFREVIAREVAQSDVMLVLIGSRWAKIEENLPGSPDKRQRLFNPGDFVRIEVETGLDQETCRVVPVLLGDAIMPASNELPPSLHNLVYRNAIQVRDDPDFNRDVERLIRFLRGEESVFDIQTAIQQFYSAFLAERWADAQEQLTAIRLSGRAPSVFDLAKHEAAVREKLALETAERARSAWRANAEIEYSAIRLMLRHEDLDHVWASWQVYAQTYADYDPDGIGALLAARMRDRDQTTRRDQDYRALVGQVRAGDNRAALRRRWRAFQARYADYDPEAIGPIIDGWSEDSGVRDRAPLRVSVPRKRRKISFAKFADEPRQPERTTARRRLERYSLYFLVASFLIILSGIGIFVVYYLTVAGHYSDAVAALTARTSDFETTIIYDATGTEIAEFNNPNTGRRTEVALDQISPWLILATLATEDETFYTDPGFSALELVRALYHDIQSGGTVSGASTITEQIARALVLETELAAQQTTERQAVEVIVAAEITRQYSKNEILEIYLNELFYGNFAYGIEAAAQTYFNKSAAALNPAEAAFLAGLPQSPAAYDPVVNREAALQRMHGVLRLMAETNGTGCIAIQHDDTTIWGITSGQNVCVKAEEMVSGEVTYYYKTSTSSNWESLTVDMARVEITVFERPTTDYAYPHYINYIWQQLEDEFGPQRIYSAGFRVTTTLDPTIQAAAEQAVTAGLATLQARGYNADNATVVVIRPTDGAVLAMVGSADYYNEAINGQVNVAFTGQLPGSAIQPFVYLAALMPDEQGRYLTPASVLWDVSTDFNGYMPVNYDRQYHGPLTVRAALGNAFNVPAVKALQFTTIERFTAVADAIGLTFPLGDPVSRNAGLPTALGSVEVRLFDMTAAYGMLANNGWQVEPYAITSIVDSDGNPVALSESADPRQVIAPEYAYLITSILSDRDARAAQFGYNTGLDLSGGRPAAVTTGTSVEARDAWTIGYTPQIVVGVWVGNTENEPTNNLTGLMGAAPIWNAVMEAAHAQEAVESFSQPSTIQQYEVCSDSGVQASANCGGPTHWEIFANDAPPPGPAQHIFVTLQVDGYTGQLANEYCADDVETRTFLNVDDSAIINWLNNTPAGQQWLSSHGLEVPILSIASAQEYCSPSDERPVVIVTAPQEHDRVEGVIYLIGTVIMPDFNRYEVSYGLSYVPSVFSEPLNVTTNQPSGSNEVLAQIDTRGLENGPYTLRLTVIDDIGRKVIRDILITVNNPAPTPSQLPGTDSTDTP